MNPRFGEPGSGDDEIQVIANPGLYQYTSPIELGRHLYKKERLMQGEVDEVYLYRTALSGDEIREVMYQK